MRLIRKLCGMRLDDNIRRAERHDLDWMGFIFWSGSKRYVGERIAYVPEHVRPFGVFVNADLDEIVATVAANRLGGVQLHGAESVDFCRRLRQLLPDGVLTVKAISVSGAADAQRASAYDGSVDYLLFDTHCGGYGGSGTSFDWGVLDNYTGRTPFLLSGGIGIDCVEALHRFSHPRLAGVDINSRFELEPGVKDIDLVADFLNQINDL
ncbi:MAG: phosphoribosylanthranilate isomerase [Candidatus Limisoma sp.]